MAIGSKNEALRACILICGGAKSPDLATSVPSVGRQQPSQQSSRRLVQNLGIHTRPSVIRTLMISTRWPKPGRDPLTWGLAYVRLTSCPLMLRSVRRSNPPWHLDVFSDELAPVRNDAIWTLLCEVLQSRSRCHPRYKKRAPERDAPQSETQPGTRVRP